ncbi:hypothetical protein H4S04_002732 [Coemansia sp. S16]|nr:hypothetical protein H4S03_000827 [Coemansia sp. S3946]KAJ2050220.1 hypothetical protein H4S04_002732 [Coemansia sp. S16]KAJ2351057.1 hypothetical protein GGH92_002036 [Coemansia sp. RSA 2673]
MARVNELGQKAFGFVWRRIRRNWWLDRVCIIFLVCVVIVFGLTYYFMNVMANVASQRSKLIEDQLGQRFTLPDVFFLFIGYVELLWMTDMFDALMFVPTAALIITHDRPWRVVSRLLLSWGLASIIRITTVAITSVPDPRPSCEYAHGNVFSTFTLHRCGDAIYSGHTLIFVVCSLVWSSFAPRNWLGRILTAFVYGLAIAGSLIVIANRAHYTIDVLLAWYIAPGAWYIVAWFWFWHVTKKGRLLKIEFPVEVGRHRDSDSEEKCQRRRVELGLMPDGTPYDPVALYLRALHGEPELSPPVSAARTTEKQEVDGAAPTAGGTPNPNDECVLTIGESSSQAFTEDFSARH